MYISFIRGSLPKDSDQSKNLFSIRNSLFFSSSNGVSSLRYINDGQLLSKAPKQYDLPFKLHLKHT
jgi:hypothetical protein